LVKILLRLLQEEEGILLKEVIIDSRTMKVHRHGGGQKGGNRPKGRAGQEYARSFIG
jgi:hypothetical protein